MGQWRVEAGALRVISIRAGGAATWAGVGTHASTILGCRHLARRAHGEGAAGKDAGSGATGCNLHTSCPVRARGVRRQIGASLHSDARPRRQDTAIPSLAGPVEPDLRRGGTLESLVGFGGSVLRAGARAAVVARSCFSVPSRWRNDQASSWSQRRVRRQDLDVSRLRYSIRIHRRGAGVPRVEGL